MLDRLSASKHQLLLIAIVRWLVIFTAVVLVELNRYYWQYSMAETPMQFSLMGYTFLAIITLARVIKTTDHHPYEVSVQLALDLVFLFILFYCSGGASNPFVSFLLFPLVVSAAVMGRSVTVSLLLLALLLYAALFLLPDPVALGQTQSDVESGSMDHGSMDHSFTDHGFTDHGFTDHSSIGSSSIDHSAHAHHNMLAEVEDSGSAFSMHVLGMWVNFAIIATLVCTVVVMMASRLNEQIRKVNQQREEALQREQLLGIATEAASVAHHMGTPLSTIAIIVHELKTMPEFASASDEIDVLQSQVDICKKELAQLRAKTEVQTLAEPMIASVLPLIAEVRQEFQILRPQAEVDWRVADNLNAVQVRSTPSLRLAMLNLLNNAADAAEALITVDVYKKDSEEFFIDILDQGPGIDDALTGEVIQPVKSQKHESVGLGLYLSHASINHVNGSVKLSNVEPRGTLTQVRLPMVKMNG